MTTLKFDNYVYPLLEGNLNIANSNYNQEVPHSFGLSVFHQDPKTVGLFSHNSSLTNTVDTLTAGTDYSGNLVTTLTGGTSLGNTTLNKNNHTLTIYYDGNTYTGTLDTSSNISYVITNTSGGVYRSDASGHFSATLYDVTHGGKFTIYSNAFTYAPSSGSNVNIGTSQVTIPLSELNTAVNLTRTHAVSISSYVTYVDTTIPT